eukprot:Skav202629  [mRNA]  locus=scaffold2813:115751:119353:- [translate_table: standard]
MARCARAVLWLKPRFAALGLATMEDVEVEVVNLTGTTVATVSLPPTASVADLKERIADASGTPVPLQRLVVPSRPLADEEPLSMLTLSGETEISVILILQELPPLDFEVNGEVQQIASVQVKSGDELVKVQLAESPNMVLKRLLQSESSILCGLPSGKFFGTHPLGLPPCGTWGWIRLADSDHVCGLRVMSHPTCGNTTPSGSFMIEYLGTMTSRIRIEEGSTVYNTAKRQALRKLAVDEAPVTVEAINLGQGVMAVHQHAPLEALITSFAPDMSLISVKLGSTEMITVATDAFEELLPRGEFFLPVSTCAHLNHVPRRYNPSWFQRKLRQLMQPLPLLEVMELLVSELQRLDGISKLAPVHVPRGAAPDPVRHGVAGPRRG